MQAERHDLEEKFTNAVNASILLKNKQKRELLSAARSWPDAVILWLIEKIQDKNRIMDTFIATALENDTEGKYLRELQKDTKNIRHQAGKLDQSLSGQIAETMLNEL